jgi:hypothetical protein
MLSRNTIELPPAGKALHPEHCTGEWICVPAIDEVPGEKKTDIGSQLLLEFTLICFAFRFPMFENEPRSIGSLVTCRNVECTVAVALLIVADSKLRET